MYVQKEPPITLEDYKQDTDSQHGYLCPECGRELQGRELGIGYCMHCWRKFEGEKKEELDGW